MHTRNKLRLLTFLILGVFLALLIFGFSQVNAASIHGYPVAGKLTPSPTFDPVLYQEDSTPITIASTILVGIIFFALILFIFRQRAE